MELEKIGIWMDLPFDQFSREKQQQFVKDLVELAGSSADEIEEVRFWEGCVKFEAKIDQKAIEFLVEIYGDVKSVGEKDKIEIPESVQKMIEFIRQYKVRALRKGGLGGLSAEIIVKTNTDDNDERDAVFFVHGFSGGSETFGSLPEYISNELDVETYVYVYPTGFLGHTPSLYNVAQNLDNWVRNNLKSEKRRIAFVGHSMGGLVIRKMLGTQICRENPMDDKVKQITFVASPSTGVWIAKAAKYFSGILQVSELDPGSSTLSDLTSTWNAWLKRNQRLSSNIRSIYGTNDNIVDAAIAMGSDPEAVPILGATHIDIVKPRSKSAEIVQTIVRFMREADSSPLNDIHGPRPSKLQ